jgi:hypothetical protein
MFERDLASLRGRQSKSSLQIGMISIENVDFELVEAF